MVDLVEKQCCGKEEQVWMLGKAHLVITCPACGNEVDNVGPSFNNCHYKLIGLRHDGKRIDTGWQQVGNQLVWWKGEINDKWRVLEIRVKVIA